MIHPVILWLVATKELVMNTLNEKSIHFQEAGIPEIAEGALTLAYYRALAAGCKVVQAVNGQLIEFSPDGFVRVLKSVPPPSAVMPSQRSIYLKK
ncbi:MAG: hypothetical protein ACK53K_01865 [Burkholderiales bacterium]